MSDWAQPFVDAGWTFDDTDQTVTSPGDWRAELGVVIDATGRWRVRLATCDVAGEHRREYGFKRFHQLAGEPEAYGRFVDTLVDGAATLTDRSRKRLAKDLAAEVNRAGATMVWFKGSRKKVTL